MRASVLLCVLVSPLAACGGGQPPPAAAPSPAPTSSEALGAAGAAVAPGASAPAASTSRPLPPGPGQWDSWSHEQKLAYMKSAVLPKMGPILHDFDPKRFAEPKCPLCHGAGAQDGTFSMPNPELPKLPVTPEGFKRLSDQHPRIVEFMTNKVVPTMAALVGEEPYDPKTQKGFGCFECHTKK